MITEFLPVLNVLGRLLLFFTLAYVFPLAWSLAEGDGVAVDFVIALLANLALGLVLTFATQGHRRELKARDGFLLVTLAWTLIAAISAVPLLIAYPELSFTKAFFEMVSAMTTTGATIMTALDHAPPSINFWRHFVQWTGGMGIIVLAVAVLPLLGVGGMQLYRAEAPGPMKDSRLSERMSDTARALWLVYAGLTLACIGALNLAGMSWLDSVCHAFSAMALGGFSTRDASVSAFDSPAIEAVLIAFMMVAGINFATHFLAWRDRALRCYLLDAEARAFFLWVGGSCLAIAAYLWSQGVYPSFATALRHATFNTVSLATTSGYMSVDYDKWPLVAALWMLCLSGFASCSGSTGGGVKMVRAIIMVKEARRQIHKTLHPNLVEKIKVGTLPVPNKVVFAVMSFGLVYAATAVASATLLVASGMDFLSGVSAMLACINNAGPGLGAVGPARNYAELSAFQLWVLSATMLLGRLEIMSVLVLLTPAFWRK